MEQHLMNGRRLSVQPSLRKQLNWTVPIMEAHTKNKKNKNFELDESAETMLYVENN